MAGIIKIREMYTPQAHFICDRSKNSLCPRVQKNLPCGDCQGTKYIEFAKVFDSEEEMNKMDYEKYHNRIRKTQKVIGILVVVMIIVIAITNIIWVKEIVNSDLPTWFKWFLLSK